jgi:hypothetical protein
MENKNWTPKVNEIVFWGCDAVQVMTMNFSGKVAVKIIGANKKSKIVRNVYACQLEQIF